MENKTVSPAVRHESKDNRAAWIAPAIVGYDIEEATRGSVPNPDVDGVGFAYS